MFEISSAAGEGALEISHKSQGEESRNQTTNLSRTI